MGFLSLGDRQRFPRESLSMSCRGIASIGQPIATISFKFGKPTSGSSLVTCVSVNARLSSELRLANGARLQTCVQFITNSFNSTSPARGDKSQTWLPLHFHPPQSTFCNCFSPLSASSLVTSGEWNLSFLSLPSPASGSKLVIRGLPKLRDSSSGKFANG